MVTAYIGLGSNLGDRQQTLGEAVRRLAAVPGIEAVRSSRAIETAPVGGPEGQSRVLNAAAEVTTTLGPHQLLAFLHRVEAELGRRRSVPNAPRTIDLDLLLYGDRRIDGPALRVPHPRLPFRYFVLEPLAELAPDVVHPELQWTMGHLLANLRRRPRYVAVVGPIGVGKTTVARAVAARTGATLVEERLTERLRLEAFYRDPARSAPRTQQAFLDARRDALLSDRWRRHGAAWLVSDFALAQCGVFGQLVLEDNRRRVYDDDLRRAAERTVRPTFLVQLDAGSQELLTRVRRRGRPFEQGVTLEYLTRVRDAFRQWRPGMPIWRPEGEGLEAIVDDVCLLMESGGA